MGKKLYTATYRLDGKKYFFRSTVSQKEADRKAFLDKEKRINGTLLIADNINVKDYAIEWLKTYKKGIVAAATYNSYTHFVKNYIISELGTLPVKKVRKSNLQKLLNEQAGKSKSHIHKIKITLQQIFNQAVEDDLIAKSPAASLEEPSGSVGERRSVTDAEREAILKVAEYHTAGLWVIMMLYTGIRPQESAVLQWKDIDTVNHRLNINKAIGADNSTKTPKSKAGVRSIPIPPPLWDRLQPLIPNKLDDYIFKSNSGEHFTKTVMRARWKSFLHDVDIELGAKYIMSYNHKKIIKSVVADDLVPYCLRHTYCTDLEAAGVPIDVASKLMGHSKIAITAEIYTHMRTDIMDDAAEKIAEYANKVKVAQMVAPTASNNDIT